MGVRAALSEFGVAVGAGPIELAAQGVVNLQMGPGQRLALEEVDDDILLYLTVDVPHLDPARCLSLLQACDLHRRPAHEPCVQVGLKGQGADAQVVLLLRWPTAGLQASQLLAGLSLLEQCRRDWLGMAG